MTIGKARPWGAAIHIDPRWKPNGTLARHRPYFFYENAELFPCDPSGFRVPPGHASVRARYAAEQGKPSVFCYGGSTTFGVYCDAANTYPAQLEKHLGRPCYNLGLQSLDLYGNYLTFVDNLRDGLVPRTAIFLDGINENQGFLQAVSEDRTTYRQEFRQFSGFRDLVRNVSLRYRIKRLIDNHLSKQTIAANPDAAERFAADQAAYYLASMRAIQKIAAGFGINCVFLLQPSVWDIWGEALDDPRYRYLKALYAHITDGAGGRVLDISKSVPLDLESFVDWAHLDANGNAVLGEYVASLEAVYAS